MLKVLYCSISRLDINHNNKKIKILAKEQTKTKTGPYRES